MEKINKPYFLTLTRAEQKSAVEAMIFASDEVITLDSLYKILVLNDTDTKELEVDEEGNFKLLKNVSAQAEKAIDEEFGYTTNDLLELIEEVNNDLLNSNRPYSIVDYAGGFQFATRPAYGALVQNLIKAKTKRRLSQAALEVLAIIAYRQPITKPEIELIRGVNSSEVVNSLTEKTFVRISGRKDSLGKPLLYSTTDDFLRAFGLKDLHELPKLRELDELAESVSSRMSESDDFILDIQMDEPLNGQIEIPNLMDMNEEMENPSYQEMDETIENQIHLETNETIEASPQLESAESIEIPSLLDSEVTIKRYTNITMDEVTELTPIQLPNESTEILEN